MFTYKIKKKILVDGIKLVVKGEKQNKKHKFITKISYKELQKIDYKGFVENLVAGLEKKIDLIIVNDIY
jgi:hypothetical protein